MRLGPHETTVLAALAQAPELLPDYFGARPGLRGRIRERILGDDDRTRFDVGRLVPTCYLRWWLPHVHRSTLSRTLASLERKGLVDRMESEAFILGDGMAWGSYTKLVALTNGSPEC